ncbi:hypothetical protein PFISCL1PPCAC_358, partial [Pristionchus fissidentatus]
DFEAMKRKNMGMLMDVWFGNFLLELQVREYALMPDRIADRTFWLVSFLFAAREVNKESELMDYFRKTMSTDTTWEEQPAGGLRHYLIFALCSVRHAFAADQYTTVKGMMAIIHDRDPATRIALFTPTDILWAFRGATDEPANIPNALKLYKKYALKNVDEFVQPLLDKFAATPEKETQMKR